MAIALPTGYIRTTVEPLDALYLDNTVPAALVPYPSTLAANTIIPIQARYLGQFVNIDDGSGGSELYWYKDGIQGSAILDPGDLVPFSAGGGSSSFINSAPMPIAVGGYAINTNFPTATNMQTMWQGLLYPYVQPTMNGGLSPTSNLFNAQNITVTGTLAGGGGGPFFFTWTQVNGSVDLVSATIEYRRGGGGAWTTLATTTSPPTYAGATTVDVNTTGAFIINQAGIDNGTLEMRCEFIDLNSPTPYYSPVITSSFAIYAAPSITNLFNDPTPGFAAGTYKLIKNFTPYSNTYITGTINRNTPLVNITGYDVQYSSNGAPLSWTTLPGGPYPGGAGATINVGPFTESSISIAGTTGYFTRILTSDTEYPTLTAIQNSTVNSGDYTIYNPVFVGFISNVDFLAGAPYNLANVVNLGGYQTLVPNGSNNNGNASGGTCNYTGLAPDKVLNGLKFQSSPGDHFIIAYPAAYGALTFFGTGPNNFLPNFAFTTQAVTTLTGGGSVSYNVYVQVNANSAQTFLGYNMY